MNRDLLLGALLAICCGGCQGGKTERTYQPPTGGDPSHGLQLARSAGCGACHIIPGIRPERGYIGPSLKELRRRAVIAGRLPNDTDHLVRWLRDPQGIDRETAMPNLGLTEPEARDIAAFLYTLAES
jgi:cytochrome c1